MKTLTLIMNLPAIMRIDVSNICLNPMISIMKMIINAIHMKMNIAMNIDTQKGIAGITTSTNVMSQNT